MNNKHANNVNLLFSPDALSTDDLFYYPFFAGASPVCSNGQRIENKEGRGNSRGQFNCVPV